MSRIKKSLLALLVLVVALGVAFWWFILRDDAKPKASLGALTKGSTAATADSGKGVDGSWVVKPNGQKVFVGYRINELFGGDTIKKTATGRTYTPKGTLTVVGKQATAGKIEVETGDLLTGQTRRDNFIKGNALETNQFRSATFELTSPIAIGTAAKGTKFSTRAAGKLTMHGVTKDVHASIDATWNGDVLDMAGNIAIVLADYNIEPPNIGGFVSVDDHGAVEFQLEFVRG